MSLLTLVLFIAGVVLLIAGAELLVRGASRLAVAAGITPLVVGLTIVAFGTGSPELAVGINASLAGQADLTMGNVVGSNIFNVLFILGLSSLVAPLVVSQQLVRLDVPLMIAASGAVYLMALDRVISPLEGIILFAGSIVYTVLLVRMSRRETARVQAQDEAGTGASEKEPTRWVVQVLLVLTGLGLLVVGSSWLVDGAVAIARTLGVSELIVGLTIIAAGTSLPEVATSVIAGLRGERDIAVGNVVGSNIFNILVVLGLTAAISPGGLSVAAPALNFDLPVMVAAAIICLPIFFLDYRIGRWDGALFISYYIFYTLYLVLAASEHDALPKFSALMMYVVIPLTIATLAFAFLRPLRHRSGGSAAA